MELQSITNTLLQEAKESAKMMINDAQELSEKMITKQIQLGTKEANSKRLLMLKKATNEADMERLHKIANSKITSNWIVLSRKEKIISTVMKEAKQSLQNLTQTKKYVPMLENLIIEGGVILGGKKIEVFLNTKDSKLPLDFNKITKKVISRTKTEAKMSLSKEKIQTIGGVLLRTKDGKVIMDNTFDDKLRQKEKILKDKISKILFK